MTCLNDDTFGPAVRGCRGDFDFTQRFVDIVFSILPASLFIVFGLLRVAFLVRRPVSIAGGLWLRWTKLLLAIGFLSFELSQLVLSSQNATTWISGLRLPANALRLAAVVVILPLTVLEHSRCGKPSMLLELYLSITLLLDICRVRTLWLSSKSANSPLHWAHLAIVSVIFKAALLFFEAFGKGRWRQHKSSGSPEEASGLFNLSTYAWLNRLFHIGFTKVLSIDDLYHMDEAMTVETMRVSDKMKLEKHPAGVDASRAWLIRTLTSALMVPLLLPVLPRVAVIGFTFCQPFLIESVLAHLEDPQSEAVGYGLIGATALIYSGIALSHALYFYWQERFVCMARGLLVTAIYRKTTALPTTVVSDSAALTLMNTDIQRIKLGFLPLHEYWANTIEFALACWLLERKIGAAFAAPVVVVLVCVAASAGVASLTGKRQRAWMKTIEDRVAATSAMISTIKSLRISGMIEATEKLIHGLRVHELAIGGQWRLMLVLAVALSYTPTTIGPLMAFAVTSSTLSVTRVFPAMAFIMLMATPLISLFQNIPNLISALACLSRIEKFLDQPNGVDCRTNFQHQSPGKGPSGSLLDAESAGKVNPLAIEISNGSFGWSSGGAVLSNIDLQFPSGSLTIVKGPVACGKSTLLKAILGETPVSQGIIRFGTGPSGIAYCDQKPFLSDGTIRSNIVGNSSFDSSRYQSVIYAASLDPDLRALSLSDYTKIGSSGMSLSGGQQARVALARALYLPAKTYILDDLMSGLDASTAALVFDRAFGPNGLLRRIGATIVLCTHDDRYTAFADQIIILEHGTAISGSLVELQLKGYLKDIQQETEPSNAERSDGMAELHAPELAETTKGVAEDGSIAKKDKSRQTGDFEVYGHYFSSMAVWVIAAFGVACCCFGFTVNFPNIWLKFWSSDVVREDPEKTNSFYIGIYGLLQVSNLLSLSGVVLLCTQAMISQSGLTLHQTTLRAVIQAPLRFFSNTDAGLIVNLFAQDMTLIDSELPLALLNFSASVFSVIGAAAVIATSSPWLAISYPFLIGVLWVIQLFYLRTSRQLRLLDLEAQAPLFSHFMSTLSGLTTIRAHRQVDHFTATNDYLLDRSQRPSYLLAVIQRWLQTVLRFVVAIIATVVVTIATQIRSDSGLTGASLITLMSFGDQLALIVQSYTQLETSIGAVARLKNFSASTPSEKDEGKAGAPDKSWPSRGSITIRGVSASYSTDDSWTDKDNDLALKDVGLDIRPGERVAVCGRTGSGKSSLVLLILRLLDPLLCGETQGCVNIDDLSLQSIDRDIVRRRIIAVSQDPIFLPASPQSTIRANLDPYHEATSDEIHEVLKLLDLGFLARGNGTSNDNGIEDIFTSDTLSQGQKQLMSLARAVIRRRARSRSGANGGVLLLDEATSSVDSNTDEIMFKTIEQEFKGYTTLAVAHRLDWAMRCDRVVMMEAGRVVETGSPQDLMQLGDSAFKRLCDSRSK